MFRGEALLKQPLKNFPLINADEHRFMDKPAKDNCGKKIAIRARGVGRNNEEQWRKRRE